MSFPRLQPAKVGMRCDAIPHVFLCLGGKQVGGVQVAICSCCSISIAFNRIRLWRTSSEDNGDSSCCCDKFFVSGGVPRCLRLFEGHARPPLVFNFQVIALRSGWFRFNTTSKTLPVNQGQSTHPSHRQPMLMRKLYCPALSTSLEDTAFTVSSSTLRGSTEAALDPRDV